MRKGEIKTLKGAQAPPGALFSQGIRAGDLIFISGGPMGLDGKFIKADFKAASKRVFENTEAVSKAAGSSLANAVRVDAYMRDLENFADFAEVYLEYVPKPYPILGVCQPARPPTDTPLGTIATILAGGLEKEEIKTEKAGTPPNALFSQGIKAANFIFTQAGPFDLDGRLIRADFKTCAKRTYENVRAVLEAANSSLENVVRVDVYLRDLENLGIFNDIHKEYVNPPYPALSICQPSRQPLDTQISIFVIALARELRKEEIKTPKAAMPPSGMLFSQGIRAGDYVLVTAGPFDLDGRLIRADFKTCAKRTYENVRAVLEAAGLSMANLVRTDNYLRDLEDVDEFNEVYAECVPKPYPARGLCQPARLPLNMPVATVATAIA